MELGLTHLVDARLLSHVEATRAFYAGRPAGRGPSSREELEVVRAGLPVPAATSRRRLLLEIHGGGFCLGSAAASDERNRQLADSLGVVVAAVGYRLAPEHRWPAAPDDCETAALWLAETAPDRWLTSHLTPPSARA
jgi:acetyl esterase/lipase